jgi:hypothetical protein
LSKPMADLFPPNKQRAALRKLAAAINSSPKALRDDECGDPRIGGSSGHVYADPRGYQVYVERDSARAWTAAKKALAFAQLAQDGDTEGVLFIPHPPSAISASQAEALRRVVGIRRRREVSDEVRAKATERLALARERASINRGSQTAGLTKGLPSNTEEAPNVLSS